MACSSSAKHGYQSRSERGALVYIPAHLFQGGILQMRKQARDSLNQYFQKMEDCILTRGEVAQIVRTQRTGDILRHLTFDEILEFLLREKLIKEAAFTSAKYGTVVRYFRGEHSPLEFGLSLQRNSFLSHRTALAVHGLEIPSNVVYVNREQSRKGPPGEITQSAITLAFGNRQRESQYVFTRAKIKYVLLSGKHINNAGVIFTKTSSGERVHVTDLERTLIDIVVRPTYAGGIKRVADVYMRAGGLVNVDHMLKTIKELDHAYPYHQAIGFLLERAGRSEDDTERFAALGKRFDFFLGYGIEQRGYSEKWRLYYPSSLDQRKKPAPLRV